MRSASRNAHRPSGFPVFSLITGTPSFVASTKEGVPVISENTGKPDGRWAFREADRMRSLLRTPPHLRRGQVGVPQRNKGHWYKPRRAFRPTPFIDDPVVVH